MGYFTFRKLIARHPNDALGIFDMKIKKKLILEKEGRHKGWSSSIVEYNPDHYYHTDEIKRILKEHIQKEVHDDRFIPDDDHDEMLWIKSEREKQDRDFINSRNHRSIWFFNF